MGEAGSESKTISFNLKAEPCSSNYFELDQNNNVNKIYDLESIICLSEDQATLPENMQNLNIFGRFDSAEQGKIVILMERCKVDCKSKETIDNTLGRSNIAIYTLNHAIDLKSKNDPFYKTILGTFMSSDSKYTKLLDIFMKKVNVTTDLNYILKGHTEKNYILVDSYTESISSEYDQLIFKTQIQMSSKSETITREYKKLFSFIAELGGYIKAFAIFGFLYKPFLKRLYYMEVINTLYRVERDRSIKGIHLSPEEEEKIKLEQEQAHAGRKENDSDFEDLLDENKKKELSDLQADEVGRDSVRTGSMLEGEVDLEDKKDKRVSLKFNWIDWVAVVMPCLKTKKHKLLNKVS